jgi:hypothetical protein
MMWGLIGGLPAGLLGGGVADLLHLPTRLLLEWIAGVARVTSRLPLPQLDLRTSITLASVVLVAWLLRTTRVRRPACSAFLAASLVVVAAGASPATSAADGSALARGAELWRRDGAVVVVVAGNADGGRLLEALRTNGVRRIDLLVVRSGGSAGARLAELVRHRSDVRLVVGPEGHRIPDAEVLRPGSTLRVGRLDVTAEGGRERLDVRVGSAAPCASPSGPATTTCPPALW